MLESPVRLAVHPGADHKPAVVVDRGAEDGAPGVAADLARLGVAAEGVVFRYGRGVVDLGAGISQGCRSSDEGEGSGDEDKDFVFHGVVLSVVWFGSWLMSNYIFPIHPILNYQKNKITKKII